MVTNYEGENIEFKDVLPLLPIREIVIHPFMIIPLFVGTESLEEFNRQREQDGAVFLRSDFRKG